MRHFEYQIDFLMKTPVHFPNSYETIQTGIRDLKFECVSIDMIKGHSEG